MLPADFAAGGSRGGAARLGRDVDHVVVGDPEARGAEPVAVQARADALAVAEHEQRGAVPALLQALVELVEVHDLRTHACTHTQASQPCASPACMLCMRVWSSSP